MKKMRGITLIALIVTVIILLILAGISINLIGGSNGILSRASSAMDKNNMETAKEQVTFKISEYQSDYYDGKYVSREIGQEVQAGDWIYEKCKDQNVTTQNYEFTITLPKDKEEADFENPYIVTILKNNRLKAPIIGMLSVDGTLEWNSILIEEGDSKEEEDKKLTVVAKNVDMSNITRKSELAISDLFEITWGSDGEGNVEYTVIGNLKFNHTDFKSQEIDNLTELELGNYSIICEATSPNKTQASATKENVNITTLATTSLNGEEKALYSEYDLAYFRDLVNSGQKTMNAKVMNHLDLTKVCSESLGNWEPIGTSTNKYTGVFDGGGKTIDNIYVDCNEAGVGLFGYIEQARISNIKLANGTIQGNYDVGGIVGNSNASNIEKCENDNVKVSGKGYIVKTYVDTEDDKVYKFSNLGGIIGYSYNSNVKACVNNSEAILGECCAIGGIIGADDGDQERIIENCKNTANISETLEEGQCCIGGIVGDHYRLGKILNCSNTGNISCNEAWVGGIVGETIGGKLENCSNTGNITGKVYVGGIAGQIMNTTSTIIPEINNSINEGTITSTGSKKEGAKYDGIDGIWDTGAVGGIAGRNQAGIITLCKNKGTILCSVEDVGGIVGYSLKGSMIRKCANYADINVEVSGIGGIAGYTNNCTIEECFNSGNITGTRQIGGIVGDTTYTTVKNCYNMADLEETSEEEYAAIGGLIGQVVFYEPSEGYEYLYNCYNLGMITGKNGKCVDCFVGLSRYLNYNYIYTTKALHDKVGDGLWEHEFGEKNWGAVNANPTSTKNVILSNLLSGEGAGKWTRDTTNAINGGYPYLINNVPE